MKWIAGLMVMVAMFCGCAGVQKQPAERVIFPKAKDYGKPKFSKEFSFGLGKEYLLRYVWEGDSIDEWTEAFDVFTAKRKYYPPKIDSVYQKDIEDMNKTCPESTFSVISKSSSSILWERKTVNCQQHPDENVLKRILYGNSNIFILTYTNKVKELPKDKRDEWIRVLSGAQIDVEN